MKQDMQAREKSSLFRSTRLCLTLIGYGCLAGAGVLMLKFSIGRDGAVKFTAVGIVAIEAFLLAVIWAIRRIVKKQQ